MGFITGGLAAEDYDRSYGDGELVRRILAYFRPHWRSLLLVALTISLGALVATVTPLVIARGIDDLSGSPAQAALIGLAALVTLMGALGWLFNFVRQRFSSRAVGDVVLALREDAFRAVLRRDRAFFDQHASGRIISRVTSDTQDFATVVTLTADLLSQLGVVLVVTALMFFINWRLALITVAIGPIVLGVAVGFRVMARRAMQQSQRATAEVNTVVQETISGIAVAKNFRQEAALFADFLATNEGAYRVQLRRVAVFGSIFPLLNTLSGLGTAAIIYAGGLLVYGGSVSLGDWYLFVQSLGLFFFPITSIASFWSQFQQGLAASERVFALIDDRPRLVQTASEEIGRIAGDIRFEHVDFSYDQEIRDWRLQIGEADHAEKIRDRNLEVGEAEHTSPGSHGNSADTANTHPPISNLQSPISNLQSPWVLRDFSLHIPPGQTLAVVGHTGAGKSSLIKLLLRFYEFQGGRILIDDRDIRALSLPHYRRQIGYVPQLPFLFSGSVADNIRYGRTEATREEVLAAARHLGDGSWLDDLPQGLDTDVGERGARLSLGQRQLVALARVLLQDPAILLLDEATASIDPFTEAQVQAGLATAMRDRTSIVIAHRLSTVQGADRIIVLRQGQIIESGTHEALLRDGGHYAELYTTYFRHQSLDYRPWEAA
jgi:ABC-type multidrug transport system fused ATPase/permease subunit